MKLLGSVLLCVLTFTSCSSADAYERLACYNPVESRYSFVLNNADQINFHEPRTLKARVKNTIIYYMIPEGSACYITQQQGLISNDQDNYNQEDRSYLYRDLYPQPRGDGK